MSLSVSDLASILLKRAAPLLNRFGSQLTALTRLKLSLKLLVQKRMGLLIVADVFMLFYLLIAALVGGGMPDGLYQMTVVLPIVLLGVPLLADVVAVERRSGSLALALSSPGANFYFERRLLAAGALVLLQAWAILLALWVLRLDMPFPLLLPLLHSTAAAAVVMAAVLCWAVRLRTSGAVMFAALGTVGLLSRWFFRSPIPDDPAMEGVGHVLTPIAEGSLQSLAVLTGGAIVLYLHARRRLRRPESMLS